MNATPNHGLYFYYTRLILHARKVISSDITLLAPITQILYDTLSAVVEGLVLELIYSRFDRLKTLHVSLTRQQTRKGGTL